MLRTILILSTLLLTGCTASPDDDRDSRLSAPIGGPFFAHEPPCGHSLEASSPVFLRGHDVLVRAAIRNCEKRALHVVETNGCGFGPKLIWNGSSWYLQGTATNGLSCSQAIVEYDIPPGQTVSNIGRWNGTYTDQAHGQIAVDEAPAGEYILQAFRLETRVRLLESQPPNA